MIFHTETHMTRSLGLTKADLIRESPSVASFKFPEDSQQEYLLKRYTENTLLALSMLQEVGIAELPLMYDDQYIITKYRVGKNLRQYLQESNIFDQSVRTVIAHYFAYHLFIHSLGIIHYDAHDKNVVITDADEVIIIDFGYSIFPDTREQFADSSVSELTKIASNVDAHSAEFESVFDRLVSEYHKLGSRMPLRMAYVKHFDSISLVPPVKRVHVLKRLRIGSMFFNSVIPLLNLPRDIAEETTRELELLLGQV